MGGEAEETGSRWERYWGLAQSGGVGMGGPGGQREPRRRSSRRRGQGSPLLRPWQGSPPVQGSVLTCFPRPLTSLTSDLHHNYPQPKITLSRCMGLYEASSAPLHQSTHYIDGGDRLWSTCCIPGTTHTQTHTP